MITFFVAKLCRPLEKPANCKVTLTNMNYAGSKAIFRCYDGYGMKGVSQRECLPSGEWSGSSPVCLRMYFIRK
jgi:hypothetical protein